MNNSFHSSDLPHAIFPIPDHTSAPRNHTKDVYKRQLEDIYLPYKPKRKTRAEVARQKGLEPLAILLMLQRENNLSAKAASFVKGDVKDVEDALKGARDILAEQVNEDERARNAVRNQFSRQAEISAKLVKGKEEEAAKYRDYFDFSEALKRCTSHRLLAIRRAESEGLLKVSIQPDDEACICLLYTSCLE